MSKPLSLRPLFVAPLVCTLVFAASCSSETEGDPGSGGAGGSGGSADAGDDAGPVPKPGPGEQCFDPEPEVVRVRFESGTVVMAPGTTRDVTLVVDPDFCQRETVSFASGDEKVIETPPATHVDLLNARITTTVNAVEAGTTKLTVSVPRGDGTDATAELDIEVQSADIPKCSGSGSGRVDSGKTVSGKGGLAAASIGFQAGATKPNEGSYLWSVDPFDTTIACADDQVPDGYKALGPAVEFGPADKRFQREIPFSLPMNPAAFPEGAGQRHVTVSYTGPRAATPRAIPVANPRIVKGDGGWRLEFMAPWLGTYQAIVGTKAGSSVKKRRLTHRAVIGVSMGGGGTAMAGFRNHERFDALAPLGGPVEWTWLLGHIRNNHIAGFATNDGDNVPAMDPPLAEPMLPYEHTSSFNQWWYEYPRDGNGGRFPREEYVQIFRDLSLMFGNPGGYNSAAGAENLPAGVPIDHPSVVGNRSNRECAVWIDPISGHPDEEKQRTLASECPAERCANVLRLDNFYDKDFNSKGTWPVITFCDGSPQNEALSPYANTWSDQGNDKPMELALAVDYNDNGVRDQNEPVIFQGHEPFLDLGPDGKASVDEDGYKAGENEDPAGDDWHPQYNPKGTEGNYRYDEGESYDDFGLDGVANTSTSPYDFGEGNGKFDYAPGYAKFLERDSRSVIAQDPKATPSEPFDDAASSRVSVWSDGGTRDLFNFAVSAQALTGELAARGRVAHYYTGPEFLPGQDPTSPNLYVAGNTRFRDIPETVMLRYGAIDPTAADIKQGSGQHVGTADEIVRRLQSALYYIGSHWPDAPRTLDEASELEPLPGVDECEIKGACDFDFTDSRGRTGPVSVNLPPGYANANSQDKRYPVIFMLHGYGQTPEDLKAAIIFLKNWMNTTADSSATRLPKAIMVYVDGRCRPNKSGEETECIRGTFFTDSVREKGPKTESWWMELMDEVDKRYRTMGTTEIDWTE